ncbi:hypothetical protein LUZ60_014447 [Juncus effusus]|nr:hypothetical protein LUZ60_014447 [Juncus effusus]
MATGWVRSLHCKSKVLEDVAYVPSPKRPSQSQSILPLSCSSISSQSLNQSVLFLPKHSTSSPSSKTKSRPASKPRRKKKPVPVLFPPSPLTPTLPPSSSFLSLAELPDGHSSRRVVEIIFNSSWSSRETGDLQFAGKIEVMFRVHTPARTIARFEECRDAVRYRERTAKQTDVRCAADGNEMMRFHCHPGTSTGTEPVYDASVAACSFVWGERLVNGVRTYTGSREAHDNAGGGSGTKAMLVCRVIAGRVGSGSEPDSQCDSVSMEKGELLVFDQRAVLPCFLIIYKV